MSTEEVLTKGLQAGFGGDTNMAKTSRDGFDITSSHFEDGNSVYLDEWCANRVGGGQELVSIGDQKFTRVYAGGTVSLDALESLGITKGDVMVFLKEMIMTHGEHIRLHSEYNPKFEGDWRYEYKIIDTEETIPVTIGKESIFFKETLVFVHNFIFCPVE